jgi:hypothetical protein
LDSLGSPFSTSQLKRTAKTAKLGCLFGANWGFVNAQSMGRERLNVYSQLCARAAFSVRTGRFQSFEAAREVRFARES